MNDNSDYKDQWLASLEKLTGNSDIPMVGEYEDIYYPIIIDKALQSENTDRYIAFAAYGENPGQSISNHIPDDVTLIDIYDLSDTGAYSWLEIAVAIKQVEGSSDDNIVIKIGLDDGFFIQTAKIAALRSIFKEQYPEKNLRIAAIPSSYNKYISDENNNLVRASAEYMAAILGGADILLPSDRLLYDKEESLRLSNNIIDLIRYESKMDSSGLYWKGSEVISYISYQIGDKAWSYLKENSNTDISDFNLKADELAEQHLAERKENIYKLKHTKIGYNKYRPSGKIELFVLGDFPDTSLLDDMKKHGFDISLNLSDSYDSLITSYELSQVKKGLIYSQSASNRELQNLLDELIKIDKISKKNRRPSLLKGSLTPVNIVRAIVEEGID